MSTSTIVPVAATIAARVPTIARPAAPGTSGASAAPPAVSQKTSLQKPAASAASVNASLAALQEFSETAAQTSKEAQGGDRQAQRLLAKQAAAAHPVVNTSGQVTGTIINTKA
jgi:hypothetical protein